MNAVVEVDAIVDRDALGNQVWIERIRPQYVLADRRRLETPWVVAQFDRGGPLARVPHARIVTRTTDGDR
jgi:hypothetical protein